MKTETIACKIITPTYLTGADSRQAELRAPSIKGMMRFWWRATVRKESLEDLKKKEAEIFGADSQSGGRSPFTISVQHHLNLSDFFLRPHKPTVKEKSNVKGFAEGQSFQVMFSARDQASIDKARTIFELASLLSGIGRRSRRGFGCFSYDNSSFGDEMDLLRAIEQRLNKIMPSSYCLEGGMGILPRSRSTSSDSRSNDYPTIEKIETVLSPCTTPEELLTRIGKATSSHHGIGRGGTKRLASPVVVSACPKKGSGFFVVITRLHSTDSAVTQTMMENFIQQVRNNVRNTT